MKSVFHAYKSTSNEAFLSHQEAAPLLKKLFTCDIANKKSGGALMIYSSIRYSEFLIVKPTDGYVAFNHEQLMGLLNFLKFHEIDWRTGSEVELSHLSAFAVNKQYPDDWERQAVERKYIIFPQFKSMDEFITKMESIITSKESVDVETQTSPRPMID